MEFILDELQKNNVNMNMRTLSYHINCMLERYGWLYEQMVARVGVDELSSVFNEMNADNFGRVMAYLTLVYEMKESEDVTRRAVQLAAMVLRDMNLTPFKIEESFLDKVVSGIRRMFTL